MNYGKTRPIIGAALTLFGMPHSGIPCPTCTTLAPHHIWWAMVMPLPDGAFAPLSRHGYGYICHDCAAAETLIDQGLLPKFTMARVATGNDRFESLRLPEVRFGLMAQGIVRPSRHGDLDTLLQWQHQMGYPPKEDHG